MARGAVNVEADLSGAFAATGFIKGIATEINTDKHLNSVLDLLFADLNIEFLEYMDTLAAAAPDRFHHVYEWNMVGVPTGRLFRPVMRGRGRNRTVTWDWRASKKTVPVTPEAADAGVKQVHVFVWKAPFMEYNTNGVTIEPKRHAWISAFTRDNDHGFALIKGPVHVANPGGPEVRGAFTAAFAEWWGSADRHAAWDNQKIEFEKRLGAMPIATTARKSKSFSLTTASANKAMADGQAAARKFMEELTRDYIGQARQRLEFMGEE